MVLISLELACIVLAGAGTQAASQVGESITITTGEVFVGSAPPKLAHEVVTLAYRGILGREPDAGGLDNYVKHLQDGHRQHRGIVWLCSILLESAEFNSRVADTQALDLAAQLHKGIEGCADEEPVKTTRRLLIRARSMPGSTTREILGLIASRAAFLIAHTTGALPCFGGLGFGLGSPACRCLWQLVHSFKAAQSPAASAMFQQILFACLGASLWSEGTESATSWSVASTLRYLEHATQSMLTVLRGKP